MIDYYIFGDGAGTIVDKPCGSGATILDCHEQHVTILSCCSSKGTNNFAELLPIIQSLWYLSYKNLLKTGMKIRITSDSMVTIKSGKGEYSVGPQNEILWFAVQGMIKKYDLKIEWIHVPRNSILVMADMDALAKEAKLRCIK